MSFRQAWARLHRVEGDFSDDPDDSGGATRFGVTEALARRYGYQGDMRELPYDLAMRIAKAEFWDPLMLDQISELSNLIAFELMDTAYNIGPRQTTRFLQRGLNALNRRGKDYADLSVDGRMGEKTLGALKSYRATRRGWEGTDVLFRVLDSQQAVYYLHLVERREKDERFFYGWIRARTGHDKEVSTDG